MMEKKTKNNLNIDEKKTISAKFDCINGRISLECEIISGDQLGSGKWRHGKLNLSGSDASLNLDGELYVKDDISSDYIDGSRVFTYVLHSIKNNIAEITMISSNSGTRLNVEVRTKDGKLMMISSR